jgi:SAM-dependent methyltransferase
MDTTELKYLLIASIDQQYQAHSSKELSDYIFANYTFQTVDPGLINFAYTFRQEIVAFLSTARNLEELIDYCLRATKRYTYQRNQFINFTNFYDQLIQGEYRNFLLQIRGILDDAASLKSLTIAFSRVLKEHHERLRLILSSYCLSYQDGDLRENSLLRRVPCEEYSAGFQIRLLDIDLSQIMEPILDIGCGTSGGLVNFLREKGYKAFGVDREGLSGLNFFQQDWFAFEYEKEVWGTIIAHQSYTTHFIYNHLHGSENAERYANLYMRIIASLRAGGIFYYAPGLPFFEDHLKGIGGYQFEKIMIASNNVLGIGEIFYAAKVRRVDAACFLTNG